MLPPFTFSYLPKALYRAIVKKIQEPGGSAMACNFVALFSFSYYYFFS